MKRWFKYLLVLICLMIPFMLMSPVRADSGWDSDYDSGWDSGSDWGSDWDSGSSWDDDYDYDYDAEEFAVLTGKMAEAEFKKNAEIVDGVLQMIRAEL